MLVLLIFEVIYIFVGNYEIPCSFLRLFILFARFLVVHSILFEKLKLSNLSQQMFF